MKKLMIGLMMAFAANVAMAETISNVEIDSLRYNLDTENKTAALVGCTTSLTTIDVAAVEYEGQAYAVTSVGNVAFSGCPLTSVSLPNATTIGYEAFSFCDSLASIDLPNATTIGGGTFIQCGSLASVSLPKVTTIGDFEFSSCSSLTEISLPRATTIGVSAFQECSKLTSVSLPNATMIGKNAFSECSSLASVDLPSVTMIRAGAFNKCGSLPSVSLLNATTIEDSAFARCGSLTSVSLPNVVSIGVGAFAECSKLPSVALPKVVSMGNSAFSSCDALSTLVVNATMKSLIEMNGRGGYGISDLVQIVSAQGDLKFVPEGSVVVTKESIAAAKAMTIEIVNGQVELSVSVCSNADITAEAPWTPVKFSPDVQIGLTADGTKLILPIPVAAQQGFMILQSGDAKVDPSDGTFVRAKPWYSATVREED